MCPIVFSQNFHQKRRLLHGSEVWNLSNASVLVQIAERILKHGAKWRSALLIRGADLFHVAFVLLARVGLDPGAQETEPGWVGTLAKAQSRRNQQSCKQQISF